MTNKTNLPIELQNEIIEEFRKQPFCFDGWVGNDVGKRLLHTNRDITPEVEQFLLQSIDKAYSKFVSDIEYLKVDARPEIKEWLISDSRAKALEHNRKINYVLKLIKGNK